MKRSRIILSMLLVISAGFNVYFLLKTIDASLVGGISMQSPDEVFTVVLSSLRNANPFVNEHGVYAEVKVHAGYTADKIVKRIIVSPINASNDMEYRTLKDPIKWADNSKEFTVTTPDFKLTVNMGTTTNHSMAIRGPVWQ